MWQAYCYIFSTDLYRFSFNLVYVSKKLNATFNSSPPSFHRLTDWPSPLPLVWLSPPPATSFPLPALLAPPPLAYGSPPAVACAAAPHPVTDHTRTHAHTKCQRRTRKHEKYMNHMTFMNNLWQHFYVRYFCLTAVTLLETNMLDWSLNWSHRTAPSGRSSVHCKHIAQADTHTHTRTHCWTCREQRQQPEQGDKKRPSFSYWRCK